MSFISLNNISFGYDSSKLVLDIDELSINKGERVFLHGPSGSGKSTLLNLLAGVLVPHSGEIRILDTNLKALSQTKRDVFRGDHIGFIFQRFNLINYLSIAENISLPYRTSKNRKSNTSSLESETARLVEHLNLKPYINKKVSELSVGQQQRVAVARALIGKPEIIIADEPTSSLDDDVTDKFIELLLNECEEQKTTVIFVSHNKRLAKHFDREISLKDINKARGESHD